MGLAIMKVGETISYESLALLIGETVRLVQKSVDALLDDRFNMNAVFNLEHSFVKDISDCREAISKNVEISAKEAEQFRDIIAETDSKRKHALANRFPKF